MEVAWWVYAGVGAVVMLLAKDEYTEVKQWFERERRWRRRMK